MKLEAWLQNGLAKSKHTFKQSSVADKKKRRQVLVARVTVVAALYDGRARSIITADCTVPFKQRVFRGYEKGRTHANCTT